MINNLNSESITPVDRTEAGFVPRIQILDDDSIVSRMMTLHLKNHFPKAHVETCHDTIVLPDFDIYFLDNDFNGRLMGMSLLRKIRTVSPHSLVVALSNTLDMETMKQLMNGGCNAIYNKRYPEQSGEARDVIRNYLSIVARTRSHNSQARVGDLVQSMKSLLEAWNIRLSKADATS